MARALSCTQSVHGPGHVPCTWAALYTGRKHGCVQVHDRVLRRVPCTRPCLRPMYTAVHGHVQTVYTAVHGPCTGSVHDPNSAVYTAVFTAVYAVVHGVYRPCTPRHSAYQASQELTTEIFVGRLLLKSNNNSFSRNRLVYVFGSRDLLGHNVGHVIAHAQLTL